MADEWLSKNNIFVLPRRERLIDKVATLIKELIYANKIEVGHKLPAERELARLLKVSRAVVSDALRSLERAGLVEIRPGAQGGAFVCNDVYLPLYQTMYDLLRGGRLSTSHFYEARKAIECESIREASEKATAQDVERLRSINRKLLESPGAKDIAHYRSINLSFHLALAEIGGNPIIMLMVQSLIKLVDAIHPPQSPDSRKFLTALHARHEAIIDALEAKDIARCEESMRLDAESLKMLKPVKVRRKKGE